MSRKLIPVENSEVLLATGVAITVFIGLLVTFYQYQRINVQKAERVCQQQ